MNKSEPVKAVIRMQDYIHQNINNNLSIDEICSESGYSKRHSLRIFKELLNKTIFEYIRDLRLSMATGKLIDSGNKERIIEIALDSGFESHEGFTKAFNNHFGVLPQNYRNRCFPDDYSAPTPMSYYYLLIRSKGRNNMSEIRTVTATFFKKPACKLIIKRGILSTDYFSYCDEIGCDIWDVLEKVPGRLDKVSFVILPEFLIYERTSKACCAAEVPLDYNSSLPDGCEIIELAEHTMLLFQGSPYADENWYGGAHDEIYNAIKNYKPEFYGYKFAYDSAPEFYYGATAKDGCKQLVPVTIL
ncbi:AraC family transcriptional regulator [Sedimentibacter sp.]|uniref:helix-turn-helix transcriptional regulator n=1 Tax=Sedimentibacter sp. TaxID=1960295 RepID=UPI00289E25A9|nr:AraC family transcriptional regulator [Sedimentibacter sp.]